MNNYRSYCEHCQSDVIICGKCGNNTCNGGYGEVDGVQCDQCPSAYQQYSNTTMNEKIKELWNKAAESTAAFPSGPNNSWETQVNFMEKFAELIVRECSKTVNDTEYPYEDPAHKETWDACCVWSAEKLKEHFGVE